MGAPELLHHLRGAGLVLTLTPAGGLRVAPRTALTDDHRAAIRTERDALVLALQAEAAIRAWLATIGETDPEVIRHVLAQCVEKPDLRQYLFSLTDDGAMPESRRTCRQCANLRGDICAAQANGGKLYRPQVDTLFRCEWYRPSASDDDQRTACDRWPGLSQKARQS